MLVAVVSIVEAQAPPTEDQCARRWTFNTSQEMNFGAFVAEAGTGSISMNSLGGLSTSGQISLSTSVPVSTWVMQIDNTRDAFCATYEFTLDWRQPPRPLRGPGTNIPLNNMRVSIPAYGLTDVTLPQTIPANPANTVPFSVTIYGEITAANPQTAGEYLRRQVFELAQGTRTKRERADVYATSLVPLSIAETLSMDFGTVAAGPALGTIILSTGNSRTITGDAQIFPAEPGTAASFQISGEPNQTYSLSFGNGTLENAAGQQMLVNSFTDNGTSTVPATGIGNFDVGASLNIGANQPSGIYTTGIGGGTPYSITINYN